MTTQEVLATRFEAHRGQLRAVASRLLGSTAEADDAVQETWLRLARVDAAEIENMPGWLRTVVSRICLDMLRARREEPMGELPDEIWDEAGPSAEAELVESVGRAMLVVLDRLTPAERVAFVLHDMFAVPFDEIAPIVARTQVATKKLASRARQRVRGVAPVRPADVAVVDAFLAAARLGDLDGLLAILAPDVVRRADPAAVPAGVPLLARGVRRVAEETVLLARRSRVAAPAVVDGAVGIVVAPRGRLALVLTVTVEDDRVAAYEVIGDPTRLRGLTIAVID
jgi:RNA polymerase sigma factor (sigma-70 family)